MEDDLREMICCPLCLEEAKDPRMFQCQHTFCVSCLQQYIESRPPPHSTIICPICRQQYAIPGGDAGALPKNLFHRTIRDIIQKGGKSAYLLKAQGQSSKQECSSDGCTEQPIKYCISGCGYLCSQHNTEHGSVSFTKNHQVDIVMENMEEASAVPAFPSCEKHPGMLLEVFCNPCERPICVICRELHHQRHECSELQIKVEEYKAKLERVLKQVDELIDCVKKAIDLTEKQKIDVGVSGLKFQVGTVFRHLKDKLIREEQQISEQLDLAGNAAEKTREEVKDQQQSLLAKLESVKFYGEGLLSEGKPYDYVTNAKGLETRLEIHSKAELPEFSFSAQLHQVATKEIIGVGKVKKKKVPTATLR